MTTRTPQTHFLIWIPCLLIGLSMTGGAAQAQPARGMTATHVPTQLDEPMPDESEPQDRPWTIGISDYQQKRAKSLYQAGNRFLASALFAAAAAKYRAALQYWNHPGIHYNLALALISLDRPVPAYQSIVEALRYGPDALHPDDYRRALDYQRLLRRQIAEVEVTCDEAGATVTLDGKPLFTGPGQITTLIMPGNHQIVATKPRYMNTSHVIKLTAGSSTKVELRLLSEDQVTKSTQRWSSWKPWAVVGAGLGIGAVGAGLHWQSNVNTLRANDELIVICSNGCPGDPIDVRPLRERAAWQLNAAHAAYATSGVLLATGALLAYLNQPQAVENQVLDDLVRISLTPGGPNGSSGLTVHIPF